ncbi:glucosamine--fructose-6-phosphate aminotransferase [Candidatus Photodesmus katoptron]|uniref:glutamine--fructose-6-phosphate transaminase (isomerizing) n=1 Tax=Candidatus Photodesmus anomalopis TaxID=28176 RepID=UPI0004D96B71|nr:glutamine--fructose-6-phosphate transaminase (isomerizing) [Candidatus Photodesmus katoptron]KEY90460.1 glucosamine--fructose-6-phosphate aminotransferase [Candidatus Photodesmus katoptron]
MCGIVGAVAQRNVTNILIHGLHRLEYRGYDSSGIAVVDFKSNLTRIRCLGKVKNLENALKKKKEQVFGNIGIAHTRWATHGEPSEINAHPHTSGDIAVVHNGIIENHEELRKILQSRGYIFASEADTEVLAHLIEWELRFSNSLREAVQKTTIQLEGTYGIVVIDRKNPKCLVVTRSGSPIVIGFGINENFLASDQLALLNITRHFMYLEEGDLAEITYQKVNVFDIKGQKVERKIIESNSKDHIAAKGQYHHFMQKEIFEQASSLKNAIEGRINKDLILTNGIGVHITKILQKIEHVQIIACGTSYNAGMTARYWFENLAGVACDVEIASEFRYRKFITRSNSLLITISQSGETADTLAALRLAKKKNYISFMAICNTENSSLVRESDLILMIRAGAEIGVASTKTFTNQLAILLILVTALGKQKHFISIEKEKEIVNALNLLPKQIDNLLNLNQEIQYLSKGFIDKKNTLFLGRGEFYPIAMEASLKLKEISYIHSEAYAAGELKHGPLALIDVNMPVIVLAPNNELLEKLKSNIEEVKARGGILYVFTSIDTDIKTDKGMTVISLPSISEITAPIYYTIPMQLLSYYVGLIKGTNVDQPRNLAKSVTVE